MSIDQARRTNLNRDAPSKEELQGGWDEEAFDLGFIFSRSPYPSNAKQSRDNGAPQPSAATIAASMRYSQESDNIQYLQKHYLYNSLGDMISLRVGPESVPFNVHRDVLLSASPGLAKMCKPFRATEDCIVFLLDQCPDALRSLCYWMYHDEICISHAIEHRSSDHSDPEHTTTGLFVKLWIAGDKFSMPRLMNHAIDVLLSHAKTMDLVRLSRYIYSKTKRGSNLRKLLVKVVSSKFDADDLDEHRDLISESFLLDLAKAAFLDRDQGFNRFRDRKPLQEEFCANFHVHEKGAARCVVMKGYVVADEGRP